MASNKSNEKTIKGNKSAEKVSSTASSAELVTAFAQRAATLNAALSRRSRGGFDPRSHQDALSGQFLRSYTTVLGYEANINWDRLRTWWGRSPLAQRAVNLPVDSSWMYPPPLVDGEENEDDTDLTLAWAKMTKRLKVFPMLAEVDKLSRIGPFALLVIGVNDSPASSPIDANGLDKPIGTVSTPSVNWIRAYGYTDVTEIKFDENRNSERYRLPVAYEITIKDEDFEDSFWVHWQRVIHVVSNPLGSSVYGNPILALIYNALLDEMKTSGGSAEASWRRLSIRLIQSLEPEFEIDPDNPADEAMLEASLEAIDNMIHNLTSSTILEGVKNFQVIGGEMVDPRGLWDILVLLISMNVAPTGVFLGREAAHLASSQEGRNYAASIQVRQRLHCGPNILEPFIERCIKYKLLPAPANEDYYFGAENPHSGVRVWPSILTLSDQDMAALGEQQARTFVTLWNAVMAGAPLTEDEVREGGGYLPMTDDQRDDIPDTIRVYPQDMPPTDDTEPADEPTAVDDPMPEESGQ